MQLADYLFFSTGCEEALAFYAECGLGRITQLERHGADGMPVASEAMRGKVMHARFEGPGILFFASDNHDAEPMRGSAHMLIMDDRDSTASLFARLAEGARLRHHSPSSHGEAIMVSSLIALEYSGCLIAWREHVLSI